MDQSKRRIVTQWVIANDGLTRTRDRYIVSWERDKEDGALTVYVRHEAQERDQEGAAGDRWGTAYHDTSREDALLDLIEKELSSSDV